MKPKDVKVRPVLEILVPTYKRPQKAQEAIESIILCNDHRLSVRCNSNGYEPELEKYRDTNSRINYDCFETNMGPLANGLKLYSETNADFCMILSDEDRVDSRHCKNILDFLENLDKDIKVIACSVYNSIDNKYHWKPSSNIKECDLNSYVALGPLSTYMSGLIFRVETLNHINFLNFMTPTIGNAYSHLDIILNMLLQGKMNFFYDKFVIKGEEIKFGGDGYSHKAMESYIKISNTSLNPSVYGPKARVRQFYYRENLLDSLKENIGAISLLIGKLNYIEFYYRSVLDSNKLVILPKNTIMKNEILAGYNDSIENGEHSGSAATSLFKLLLILSRFISNPIIYFLSFFNKLIRKAYMLSR